MNIFRNAFNNKGFTLLEILISMVVFTIGLLGTLIMLLSTIKGNSSSIKLTTAAQLGSRQIEEIMLMDYDTIVDSDGDGKTGWDDNESSTAEGSNLNVESGSSGEIYNIYWNVAEDWPVADTKTIRVIVTWQDGTRDKQTKFDFVKISKE